MVKKGWKWPERDKKDTKRVKKGNKMSENRQINLKNINCIYKEMEVKKQAKNKQDDCKWCDGLICVSFSPGVLYQRGGGPFTPLCPEAPFYFYNPSM